MTGRTARRGPDRRASRGAFTLLEILAVVTIIAILIAIAFPAYNAVLQKARLAQTRSEMATISTSIAEFKSKFNTEPPSYISFVGASAAALPAQTKSTLRKMFPQIDLSATSPVTASLTQAGLLGEELKGTEALVFFLGGVRRYDTATSTLTDELIGFSKNPANPFAQPPATGQSTRLVPFFDFDTTRLFRNPDAANDVGTTDQLTYRDRSSTSKPLIYASTALTGTYRDGATAAATDFPALPSGGFFKGYRKSATGPYWNPNSFQLISPGSDDQYGDGGVFDPKSTSGLDPFELDNLTNFNDGPLGG